MGYCGLRSWIQESKMGLFTKALRPFLSSGRSLSLVKYNALQMPRQSALVSSSGNFTFYRHASNFKAARVTAFGQPLEIQDVKQPKLKPDEVRIGVYCCGINSIDVSNCSGELEPQPGLPFIPGYEVRKLYTFTNKRLYFFNSKRPSVL